ncbi:hypothetical protein WJX79_008693 [Trebouxia sp. C0005]
MNMQASSKAAGAEGIVSQDAVVQSLLYQGLTEMLRTVAESRAKMATGDASDNQGYLLQEWRPFNSRQWLGEYLLARSGTQIAELREKESTPE